MTPFTSTPCRPLRSFTTSAGALLVLSAAGVLGASSASAQTSSGNLVNFSEFDSTMPALSGYGTTAFGVWGDENATHILGTSGGITPVTSGGMLRMTRTSNSVSQAAQRIDLSGAPIQAQLAAGGVAVVRASFNTALTGVQAGFGLTTTTLQNGIAGSNGTLFLDNNPATWEEVSVCVSIPPGTTSIYLDLRITNSTLPLNGSAYVDFAKLEIVNPSSDSCTCPAPIAGLNTFLFDTTDATTDGSPAAACTLGIGLDITDDIWFQWTAPQTRAYRFSTCGNALWDTKIAIYEDESGTTGSTCPSMQPLCCNDDFCGLQSECCVDLVGNQSYIIRVGSFPFSPGGPGGLTIDTCGPVPKISTNYCSANPHTGTTFAVTCVLGSRSGEADSADLYTYDLPIGVFGYYITSMDTGCVNNPAGSNGKLCVSGDIGRFSAPGQIRNSGSGTTVNLTSYGTNPEWSTLAIPRPSGSYAAMLSVTSHFQFWFRHNSSSNFSLPATVNWLD